MKKLNIESLSSYFFGLLLVTLIILKLTENINWSWWWVLLPLWGGLVLAIMLSIVAGIIISFQKRKSKIKK